MRRGAVLSLVLLVLLLPARPGAEEPPASARLRVLSPARSLLSVSERFPLQGETVVVEAEFVPAPDRALVVWRGQAWPMKGLGAGRFQGLLGVDLLEAPGVRSLLVLAEGAGGRVRVDMDLAVREQAFPVQTLSLPREKAEYDNVLLGRIDNEARQLAQLFEAPAPPAAWAVPFLPPVEDWRPSNFGARRIINGEPRSPHTGADVSLPEGTPVLAVADGRVVFAGEQFFGGKEVVVDHGGGVISMYFHLKEFGVAAGMPVRRGDRVGLVGATGRATGPHLHFGMRVTGARIDPALLPGLSPAAPR